MPKGTKVEKVYEALKREGKSKAAAARIAQATTGLSLKTGKKPKRQRKLKGTYLEG
jgi:hypothetical protein